MKTAIIIGGTSGMGRELSNILLENNWTVSVTGRRTQLLDEIKIQSNNKITT